MLVKEQLRSKIEKAIYEAMKAAMKQMMDATTGCVGGDGNVSKKFSTDDIIEAFAGEAKKCSTDIATAIDDYIKSAQITMTPGTIISTLPTLVSPAGPVTGVITLASPLTLIKSIS